jgi:uridine kinase
MIGEKLIIGEDFKKVAGELGELFLPQIKKTRSKFTISISGESGSGKSGISAALSQILMEKGIKTIILQQDDYFFYPPKTNQFMREKNLAQAGLSEVRLALLEQNLQEIREGRKEIEKPLVIFDKDQIVSETVSVEGVQAIIVDGTYSSFLGRVDQRVFIDRPYFTTKKERLERGREEQDEFLEKVLEIEHKIVSLQKDKADVVINGEFKVSVQNSKYLNKSK